MALAADRHVDTPTVLSALWRALRQVNAPTVFFRLPMQSTIVVAAQLRGNATGSADAPQFLIAPFNCATFADARAIRCDYYREFEGDVDASNLALPRAMEEHFRQALAAHNACSSVDRRGIRQRPVPATGERRAGADHPGRRRKDRGLPLPVTALPAVIRPRPRVLHCRHALPNRVRVADAPPGVRRLARGVSGASDRTDLGSTLAHRRACGDPASG